MVKGLGLFRVLGFEFGGLGFAFGILGSGFWVKDFLFYRL